MSDRAAYLVWMVLSGLSGLLVATALWGCPVNQDHQDRQDPKAQADPQVLPAEVVPGF